MEKLNDYIEDAITTLRQKKKQPNEDSILNILTSKMESITKTKLNKLIKQQRIYNKPYCGNNSYYVCEQVDNLVPIEKPPTLTLSKTTLEPSTVSLGSQKTDLKSHQKYHRNTLNGTIKVTKKSTYTAVI